MPAPESSNQWQIDAVIDQLRALAGGDKPVAAQVFLHGEDKVNLAQKVRDLVDEACKSAKAESASIGRVSDLAKSFSLTAKPEVFAALAKHPAVKAILPDYIEDIFPRPTRVVRE